MAPLTNPVPRKKIAVIGSGSAGIAALWALNRTHHDVYMYEAADRLGGHTNTVEFKHGKSKTLVDTGFIVLNSATYRMYFMRLLRQLRKLILCSQFHCFPKKYRRAYGSN
jgi:predicted NAD/FAD-binding protein